MVDEAAATFIPLRTDPFTPDEMDARRIALVREERWGAQDQDLIERDRTVEEQVRFLAGDMWSVFSKVHGRFVHAAELLGEDETRWRERPRINLCALWFDLNLARLTENPPILGSTPGGPDRVDSLLAEATDPLMKIVWRETRASRAVTELAAWMLAAGWGFLETRVDESSGQEPIPPALLEGIEAVENEEELAEIEQAIQSLASENGKRLVLDAASPLECRGEWGNTIPWSEKRWHIRRSFIPVDEVERRFGAKVQPDTASESLAATGNFLSKLLHGSGHYGSSAGRDTVGLGRSDGAAASLDLVCVDAYWERHSEHFPDGRLLVVTKSHVLYDGPRPYPNLKKFGLTSPIVYAPLQSMPGRPNGTTPLERLIPLNRAINQGWRQILKHRALMCDPMVDINNGSGLDEDTFVSRPGALVFSEWGATTEGSFRFVSPPPLGSDVWKTQESLYDLFYRLGNLHGAEGTPSTANASGELQKELRFNSDRPISTPVRNMARAIEEMGYTWLSILPVVYPTERILYYAGEDKIARTVHIVPDMWDGMVNIEVNAESMLPEGRGERRERAFRDWQSGAFGDPIMPEARSKYLEMARYPDMGRADGPAGVDRATAERNLGLLVQGTPAEMIPLRPQMNFEVLLYVTRDFMAAPEYDRLDPMIQQQCQMYWQMIEMVAAEQMMAEAEKAAAVQAQMIEAQGPAVEAGAQQQGKAAKLAAPPGEGGPPSKPKSQKPASGRKAAA